MSIKTFLKQRAVTVAVGGSYTLANWFDPQGKPRTFACRTSRVSPFRMMVDVPVVGKIGDRTSSYFSDFGKLEGHISDIKPGGFLFELAMDKSMRKMAGQLSWLEMKQKDSSIRDARMQARINPGFSAFGPDLRRWFHPQLLCHRHVGIRRRHFGQRSAADRNAVGGGNLYRPRRPASARRVRGPFRGTAEPHRTRAAYHATPTARPRRRCEGSAAHL